MAEAALNPSAVVINKEEILKEALTVTQKDTPLQTPPPEAIDKGPDAPLSQPLPVPQESESTTEPEIEKSKEKEKEKGKIPQSLVSFKEESNKLADLSYDELRALDEFKLLVQEALKNRLFLDFDVSIWGVPLLKDERSDVILLKFLRARDFDVEDAYVMLSNTIKWRRDFKVDEFFKEDLGDDLEKVVFMHGHDKEGHPVCYNVYGEFQNKELYIKTFGDEERRLRFLRWRIQFLERSIRKLDFTPGGINTIFQVSDLKNSPGPGKKELRIATKQALQVLQDNYPEFVAKQVDSAFY